MLALVTLTLVGLVACGEEPHYYISNVVYDPVQKKLDWSDNSDAKSWIVIINGEKHKTDASEYSFDAQNQDFTFSIEGLQSSEGNEYNPKRSGTMKYLAAPQNLRIQNGLLYWDAVPGAEQYEISNFGRYVNTTNETSTQIPTGSFSFTVKAMTSDYYYTYESSPLTGTILVPPTNLRYEEGIIKWDYTGTDVEFFKVVINGKEYKTTDTKLEYNGNKEDFSITVEACTSGENSYDSEPLKGDCKYLKPVSNFTFDENGNLTWGAVENAEGYRIDLNDVISTSTEPAYGNLELDKVYTIKVTPTSSQLSYTSEPEPYTFEKLSPIEGVKFSAETNTITWNKHTRATSYELIVNGEVYTTKENKYTIGRTEQDISIQVFAKGSIDNSKSFFAKEAHYTYMGTLGAPTIVEGKLVWTASETAKRYVVTFLDGTKKETTAAELTDFRKGEQHTVTVTSYGENEFYFSYPSASFTFTVLNAPIISFSQNNITWNTNEDASGYEVVVLKDGEDYANKNLSKTELVYSDTYGAAGTYEVRVRATAPETDGVYSSEFSNTYEIVRLPAPDGHKILNDTNKTDHLYLSVNEVNGANGYIVKVNGGNVYDDIKTASFNLDVFALVDNHQESTFNIEIYSKGSSPTSSKVYLDSTEAHTFTVTRLATPQNVSVVGKTVKWDSVKNAGKYVVLVNGTRYVSETNNYTLPAIGAGKTSITIYAVNDSENYMNSRPSEKLEVKKLPKVTGVDVTTDKSGNIRLEWTQIDGNTGYTVKIGTDEHSADVNAFLLSSYLTSIKEGEGVQITVYAMGDGKTTIDSEPSDTFTISRFNRPQGLKVNGSNITWDACTINDKPATGYSVKINGQEYNATGTSFSTADLDPGEYTISVKALGDNKHTLDSEFSSTITVTKLGEVKEIKTEAGSNLIKWDAVQGAESYVVNVTDSNEKITQKTELVFAPTAAKTYTITIYARSNSANTINGTTTTHQITVSALTAPKKADDLSALGTFTVTQENDKYTININAPVNAVPTENVSYTVSVGGKTIAPTSTGGSLFEGTMTVPNKDYVVKVKYNVSCFGSDGVYYIDSNESTPVTISYE